MAPVGLAHPSQGWAQDEKLTNQDLFRDGQRSSPESGRQPQDICWNSFFFFFRPTPIAYGSSQARGRIRAVAATATAMWDPSRNCDLHYSSWQHRTLNPLSKARDQTWVLMDTSCVCSLLSYVGNSLCWNSSEKEALST